MKLLFSLPLFVFFLSSILYADTFTVNPGESIQAAINQANDGDDIQVNNGTYNENINFLGKNIKVVSTGPQTIINGTALGPVVTFENAEQAGAVLDSFMITGGNATNGGGIKIDGSSPTILRNIVIKNKSSDGGSGIYVTNSATPLIMNNVIARNKLSGKAGDPHGIQVISASPVIINNTIAYNDSNGIFIQGSTSNATVMNNVIARNGKIRNGNAIKGRGICEFDGNSLIMFNLFFKNAVSAFIAQNGRDFGRITKAQRKLNEARIQNNKDGNPRFKRQRKNNFNLRKRKSRAKNKGNPALEYNDKDGSRNDIGFSGGPESI